MGGGGKRWQPLGKVQSVSTTARCVGNSSSYAPGSIKEERKRVGEMTEAIVAAGQKLPDRGLPATGFICCSARDLDFGDAMRAVATLAGAAGGALFSPACTCFLRTRSEQRCTCAGPGEWLLAIIPDLMRRQSWCSALLRSADPAIAPPEKAGLL